MTGLERRDSTQITAHVCASERAGFEVYARRYGLDAAGLLALLLARELRIGRLHALIDSDTPTKASKKTKVTVHGREPGLRDGILARAVECGTSLSNACAVLMRAELSEQWLEQSIVTRSES